MVKLTHIACYFALGLGLSACREAPAPSGSPEAQQRYETYLENISRFFETRNVENICAAGNIAGNLEAPFPMTKSARAETFVTLILIGLREGEAQATSPAHKSCANTLWEALYIGRPARLKISRPMANCLDDARVDGLFSADAYLTCAKSLSYTPY